MGFLNKSEADEQPNGRIKKFLAYGFGVILVIASLTGGPNVVIEQGVARVDTILITGPLMDLDLAAYNILQDTYKIVQNHPEIQAMAQTISLSKHGLSDQYGNPLRENIVMGTVIWTKEDVEDIRKFQTDGAFTQNERYRDVMMVRLSLMQGAELLR